MLRLEGVDGGVFRKPYWREMLTVGLTETFTIETEVTGAYYEALQRFISQNYLLPHPERFRNIVMTRVDGDYVLAFTAFGPEDKWFVNVNFRVGKPVVIEVSPSDDSVPQAALTQLKEDLVIGIQLFEENVRKTTMFFAWVEGMEVKLEKLPSKLRKGVDKMFMETMIFFFILFLVGSIVAFMVLGMYAPIVLVALQFILVLFSNRVIQRSADWVISRENPTVHVLQYHIPAEDLKVFQQKYRSEELLRVKAEIYERSLASGRELNCETAGEVFEKHGIKCLPENMASKKVNLYDLVGKAAERFNLPTPKVVVSNIMLPNAAATGVTPSLGTVLVTTGILIQLEEDELLSVVGHELSHLKGRDPLILFTLSSAEYLLRVYVLWPIVLFSPFIYFFFTMWVIYFIAKFLEARADLESAINMGQPQVLAEALRKIGYQKLRYERLPSYRAQGWLGWDPHPPIYFRVNRLEKLDTPVKIRHTLLRSIKECVEGLFAAVLG